ncbi:MAG: ChaB family protein [Coleofasciculus sp. G3-WIS-01]|uniref:ChaB family protein n=1 Tax=Coleofasciculus sp. G3-WIS-01 TaxID=3069528 RepID=UPI0032F95ADC
MAINVKICNKQAIADLGDGGTAALVLAGENKYSLKRWSDQRKRFQQIFCAAYNSASRDGLNDNQAHQVAWNSVKNSYEEVLFGDILAINQPNQHQRPYCQIL